MPEPDIPTVSSGQVIASTWGNTVRTKVQDTTDGHKHDGVGSKLSDQGSARIFYGLAAAKGTAGTAGRLYFETDTKILQYDNVSAWVEILRGEAAIRLAQLSEKTHASLTSVTEDQHHAKVHGLTEHNEGSAKITGGLDAAKPAAGTPWRMYWATNTGILYLDNGTAWIEILRAEAATRLASIAEKSHGSLANVTADQHHARSHDHSNALDGSPIAVAGVPDLPATKITSLRLALARLPDGTLNYVLKGQGAGVDPAYGQVAHTELTGVTSNQHHARLHDHSLAADGTPIAVAGVPDLPATKITSLRFTLARLPDGTLNYVLKGAGAGFDPVYGQVAHTELTGITADQHHAQLHKASHESGGGDALTALDAGIITSGILAAARGGLAKALSPTWTNDYIMVYKTAQDNWQMEAKGTPAAHEASHVDGGTDEIDSSLDERAYPMKADLIANRPAAGVAGRFFWSTDEHILYRDNGTAWVKVAVADHPDLDGVTTDQHHAQLHASAHHSGGGDALALGSIAGTLVSAQHPSGLGTDLHHAQLHKDAHKSGGGDAFVLADLLDCIARTTIRKNTGADIGSRRRLNLIEGSNVLLTVADDATGEEVDVTVKSDIYAVLTPLGAILPATGAPAQTRVTGTNFVYYVLDFDAATAETCYYQFKLPPNYAVGASIKVVIQWISTVTTGNVVWAAQFLGRASGEAFDAAMSAAQSVTTTAPGTAGLIATSEITFSSPDLAANDIVIIKLYRDAAHASDTMAADARMVMAGVVL